MCEQLQLTSVKVRRIATLRSVDSTLAKFFTDVLRKQALESLHITHFMPVLHIKKKHDSCTTEHITISSKATVRAILCLTSRLHSNSDRPTSNSILAYTNITIQSTNDAGDGLCYVCICNA